MTRKEAIELLESHIYTWAHSRYSNSIATEICNATLQGTFKGIACMSGDDEFMVKVILGIRDQYPLN